MEQARHKGLYQPETHEAAISHHEKYLMLQAVATIKDGNGGRAVNSIKLIDPITGEEKRVNYQESLFDLSNYTQLIPKTAKTALHYVSKAKNLNDNCVRKFNTDVAAKELTFDFNTICEEMGLNEISDNATA